MLNGYKKSGSTFSAEKLKLEMKKMEAELNELRYFMERNVERRTETLLKRIAVLESCNAALCDKLALASKESVVPKQPSAHTLPNINAGSNERGMKLYVMNGQARKPIYTHSQDIWGEHATAA